MENNIKIANLYIASLKAITLIHQNSHWISKGEDFYGNHLLFERLYDSALENLDLAAEKFIGVYGEESLDFQMQINLLNKVLVKYQHLSEQPLKMSLAIEKDFLKSVKGILLMILISTMLLFSSSYKGEYLEYVVKQNAGEIALERIEVGKWLKNNVKK